MKIIKFTPEEIEQTKSLADVFSMMSIKINDESDGLYDIHDKNIFGNKLHYENMAMNDKTYQEIYDHLKSLGTKRRNKRGTPLPSGYSLAWANCGPVSCGPRYDEIQKFAKEDIKDYALYLIEPKDEIFMEAPNL